MEQCSASPQMRGSAMIACARSARQANHLVIVRNLVEQELSAILSAGEPEVDEFQCFLPYMLLARICHRQGDRDAMYQHRGAASKRIIDFEGFLSAADASSVHIDLITYRYLTIGFTHSLVSGLPNLETTRTGKLSLRFMNAVMRNLKLELATLERFVFTHPMGAFALHEGSMQNTCIRTCSDWCINQIQSTRSLLTLRRDNQDSRHPMG
jgi:hypothetical protein